MNIPTACYEKEVDIVARDIAGETIIVPIRNHVGDLDSIYTLNEAGTIVWRLIENTTTVKEIAETLCNIYDIDFGKASNDTIDFLKSLQEKGLIRPSQ